MAAKKAGKSRRRSRKTTVKAESLVNCLGHLTRGILLVREALKSLPPNRKLLAGAPDLEDLVDWSGAIFTDGVRPFCIGKCHIEVTPRARRARARRRSRA
jgi:hypothetical protein